MCHRQHLLAELRVSKSWMFFQEILGFSSDKEQPPDFGGDPKPKMARDYLSAQSHPTVDHALGP